MAERFVNWLYPEFRELDSREKHQLLSKARDGNFDFAEWVGLILALVLTVILTQYSVADLTPAGRFAAVLTNFIVAIPLLSLLCGLVYLRRTRRHLRELVRSRKDNS